MNKRSNAGSVRKNGRNGSFRFDKSQPQSGELSQYSKSSSRQNLIEPTKRDLSCRKSRTSRGHIRVDDVDIEVDEHGEPQESNGEVMSSRQTPIKSENHRPMSR